MQETYQSNPSAIAEALCIDSPLRPRAEKDFRQIGHSTTLTEWLDFLVDPHCGEITDKGIQQLIVLPVKKRPGTNDMKFEKYIENLRKYLLTNRYGADVVVEMLRLEAQEQEVKRGEETLSYVHSSVKFYNSTKPTLTPLGECCLARFLIDDYRLIQSILGKERTRNSAIDPLNGAHLVIQKACLWGDVQQQQSCQGDLESMLMRHAKYLDESKGSCSAIVSAE